MNINDIGALNEFLGHKLSKFPESNRSLPMARNVPGMGTTGVAGPEMSKEQLQELTSLIQVIKEKEGIINRGDCTPEAIDNFLKLALKIKDLTKNSGANASRTEMTDIIARIALNRSARHGFILNIRPEMLKSQLDEIGQYKLYSKKIYYQELAKVVERGISINQLDLHKIEMLELAPYLKYLYIDDASTPVGSDSIFTDEFIGQLLANTTKLKFLTIQNCGLTGEAFNSFKNTRELGSLFIDNCPNFNHPPAEIQMAKLYSVRLKDLPALTRINQLKFLMPFYKTDKLSAEGEAVRQGIDKLKFQMYAYFINKNPAQIDEIVEKIDRIEPEKLQKLWDQINYEARPFTFDIGILKQDPLQQLYLHCIFNDDNKIRGFYARSICESLLPIITVPMDAPLKKFYESFNPDYDLDYLKDAVKVSSHLGREKMFEYLPYLIPNPRASISISSLQNPIKLMANIVQNLNNLEKSGLLDKFDKMIPDQMTQYVLSRENLFTGNPNEDVEVLKATTAFRNLGEKWREDDLKFLESIAKQPHGKSIILSFLPSYLGYPQTKELVLAAFPRGTPDRVDFYSALSKELAENRAPFKVLAFLSEEEILELAPHLTSLTLNNDESAEFIAKLLEKTEHLEYLSIESAPTVVTDETLDHLQNRAQLRHLELVCNGVKHPLLPGMINLQEIKLYSESSHKLPLEEKLAFVSSYYAVDRNRGFKFARQLGCMKEMLQQQFPEKAAAVESWFIGKGLPFPSPQGDVPLLNEDRLKENPMHQLYLYDLFARIDTENAHILQEFLTPIVKSPMSDSLKEIYFSLMSLQYLDATLTNWNAHPPLLTTLLDEKEFKFLPYLILNESDREIMLQNMKNLDKSGLFEEFSRNFNARESTVSSLTTANLFTGNVMEDRDQLIFLGVKKNGLEFLLTLEKVTVIAFLKGAAGKCLVQENRKDLFEHEGSKVQSLVFDAYPVGDPDVAFLYEALATVIDEAVIPIRKFNFSEERLLELAPYLTCLNIGEGPSEIEDTYKFSEEFISKLLERTERLESLIFRDNCITGTELAHLRNKELLKALVIRFCKNFNQQLPPGMSNLANIQIIDSDSFNQPLPEGISNLKYLNITSKSFNQPLPQYLSELSGLSLKCPALSNLHKWNFLIDTYKENREKAVRVLPQMKISLGGSPVSADDFDLIANFANRDSVHRDQIINLIEKIGIKDLKAQIKENKTPFVNEALKNDPLQQLYIYWMSTRVPMRTVNSLEELLRPILRIPADDCLLKFYESLCSITPTETSFLKMIDKIKPAQASLAAYDREKQFEYLPYLILIHPDGWERCENNFKNLEKSGLKAEFINTIPISESVAKLVSIENFFTGNKAEDTASIEAFACINEVAFLHGQNQPIPDSISKKIEAFLNKSQGKALFQNLPLMFLKFPELQELVFSIYPPNKPEGAFIYPSLAEAVACDKLPINSLNLSVERLLELGPHLTYLCIDNSIPSVNPFTDQFIANLLEKTERLTILYISSNDLQYPIFDKFKNSERLEELNIVACYKFNQPLPAHMPNLTIFFLADCGLFDQALPEGLKNLQEFSVPKNTPMSLSNRLQSLWQFHGVDNERRLKLASGMRVSEPVLEFYYHLVSQNPTQKAVIAAQIEKMWSKELESILKRDDIPFVHEDILKKDPLQQLYIYQLGTKIKPEKYPQLKMLLDPVVRSPISPHLQNFYEWLIEHIESPFILYADPPLPSMTGDDKLKFLPYLLFCFQNDGRDNILKNFENLEKSGIVDLFCKTLPAREAIARLLSMENLFTGNREQDEVTWILAGYEFFGMDSLLRFDRDKVIEVLNRPAGRELVKDRSRLHFFLESPELLQLLYAAYPPGLPENLDFYPIERKIHGHTLMLKIIPSMPLDYPDAVMDTLKGHTFVDRINVMHYCSPGIDQSGPGRQFVAQLIQGMLPDMETQISKSKKYKFQRENFDRIVPSENKPALPSDPKKMEAYNQKKEYYQELGNLFGLALRLGYPIGEVFSKKLLHCIRSFPVEELDNMNFSGEHYLKAMADSQRYLTFVEGSTELDAETVRGILDGSDEECLNTANEDKVKAAFGKKFQRAIDEKNVEAIRGIYRGYLDNALEAYVEMAHAVAKGMREAIPYRVGEVFISKWEDLDFLTTEDLSERLQGKLSADWIKQNLQFEPAGTEQAIKIQGWINKWLDDNKDNSNALANFVQTMTGGRALSTPLKFMILDIGPYLFPHTCFNYADMNAHIDEEFLRNALDSWARGENLEFNRS